VIDALARIPLFEGLPRSELSRLLGYLHEKPFPAGTNLPVGVQPGEAAAVRRIDREKARVRGTIR